jgi:hypothetical protein
MTTPAENLPERPEPTIDPPVEPRPDALDTLSPGLLDESGALPLAQQYSPNGEVHDSA